MAVTHSWMFSKQSFPPLSFVFSLQAEPGAEQTSFLTLQHYVHAHYKQILNTNAFLYLPVQGGLT